MEGERVAQVDPLPSYGPPASLPAGLDWVTYKAAYFQGRSRHDLEAIVAYAAYRRYHEAQAEAPPTAKTETGV